MLIAHLKPQSHRIVRFLDRTIVCDWAKVRPIGNFCYDLKKRDRSLRVVALSRTIGEYRWQEPSQEIVPLVVATNADVRSIVTAGDIWYDQSIIASCDRSYEQSRNTAGDRRKHCRSVAPWLNRNQSYDPEIE